MVLEHSSLTDFGGIPMSALCENNLTELDLNQKGIGPPGAFVLAGLLPAATALTSCRCAPRGVYYRPWALVIALWVVTVVVLSRRLRAIGRCHTATHICSVLGAVWTTTRSAATLTFAAPTLPRAL